jgi:DNA-binding transcriptional LysR family regulator
MNLAALETFLAVVDAGNLNKAAERLNVTQSTVTARLDALDDALDDALGQKLLVRSRKGAQLTKAGFAFQRHAELIVRTWEQGQKAVGLP